MRYIDADALIKKIYPMGIGDGKYTINAKAVKLAIDNTPTADVVPKSEVEKLSIELFHAKEDYGDLFATLIRTKNEVAREIFGEIEKAVEDAEFEWGTIYGVKLCLAELKKKYTENENG